MNQKIVLISGFALLALIVLMSFMLDFETTPSGDSVLFVGRHAMIVLPACSDSDGGLDYYTKGYLSTLDGTFFDTCSADSRYVLEYYCSGSVRGVMQKNCKFGCGQGACKTGGRTLGISPEGSGYLLTN